jgi:DNA-damage-inducible protein D
LELRKQTSQEFKALSGAAREAGVQNRMFGIFHDAGYKGLYGGLGADAIKARKGVPEKKQFMDRMDTTPDYSRSRCSVCALYHTNPKR